MKWLFLLFVVLGWMGCSQPESSFMTVKKGQFFIGDRPVYFIGTNLWYGGILGSCGEGGDRIRLLKELDFMEQNGIRNLRILVGADGQDKKTSKVEPVLQMAPGVYNDTLFDGLDFLLAEMGKRRMYAVLYLNNSWEWSGGYSQYLEWAGYGPAPVPALAGWDKFGAYVSQYAGCDSARRLFLNHICYVVSRVNRYTGLPYHADPAIMAWQIGNEPRPFGKNNKTAFFKWIIEAAGLIKSLDTNHLVSVGSEGKNGCEGDLALWKSIHENKNIDYCTIHIWPNNWGWLDQEDLPGSVKQAVSKTMEYIDLHNQVALLLEKPLVLEEFGFPRDDMNFDAGTPSHFRDYYYKAVFDRILEGRKQSDTFAGCNFWAWGGYGRPSADNDAFWKSGEDYLGDPAQEEQGLNSVYHTDSTIDMIRKYMLEMQ